MLVIEKKNKIKIINQNKIIKKTQDPYFHLVCLSIIIFAGLL
jgi:hypothetical protein